MFHIGFAIKPLHDVVDVRIGKRVVIGFFFEQGAGINKLDFGVRFVLGQYQNRDGDGGAKKEVGCERNHGFDIIVIHQVLANFLLGPAPVENTGEADNGGAAFAGEITQGMQHKSKVGFGFGR